MFPLRIPPLLLNLKPFRPVPPVWFVRPTYKRYVCRKRTKTRSIHPKAVRIYFYYIYCFSRSPLQKCPSVRRGIFANNLCDFTERAELRSRFPNGHTIHAALLHRQQSCHRETAPIRGIPLPRTHTVLRLQGIPGTSCNPASWNQA